MLEDWVSWIKRTTDYAEQQLAKAQITDWVTEQRKRYWQFAGKMARHSDNRWSNLVLTRTPQGYRRVGTPCKRWIDDVRKFHVQNFGGEDSDWIFTAQDVTTWDSLEARFVETSIL